MFSYVISKSLADLAAWEPKTFESLARIGRESAAAHGARYLKEKECDNGVYYYNKEKDGESKEQETQ